MTSMHYDSARAVGSRSHAILVAAAGGAVQACHAGMTGDVALWVVKVVSAAILTGFAYALGAAVGAAVVARFRGR